MLAPVVVVVALAACDGGDEAQDRTPAAASTAVVSNEPASADGGTVVLRQDGCRLEPGASPIPAGPVALEVQNRTSGVGAVNIAVLDGGSMRRFLAHIEREVRLAEHGRPGLGHPSYAVPLFDVVVPAGHTDVLQGTLEPGTHVIACARLYVEADEMRPSEGLGPIEVE
jgi:hypothetical protein